MTDAPSNSESEHYHTLATFVPRFAWDSVVPLLVRRGERLCAHGTGTLFTVGRESFIVTAGHVIRTANDDNLSIYASTPATDFVQLVCPRICSAENQYGSSEDPFDVAVFHLNSELLTRFEGGRFLRVSDVRFDLNVEFGVFTAFGYPAIWTQPNRQAPSVLNAKAFEFTTYTYEGSTRALGGFEQRFHLALNATLDESRDENAQSVQFTYANGVRARFPADLAGVSGCPVWHIGDRRAKLDEWTAEPRLVAVQTAVYPDKGVMKATRWIAVTTLLNDAFPQLRPVFKIAGI